jgi:hypothetical protein
MAGSLSSWPKSCCIREKFIVVEVVKIEEGCSACLQTLAFPGYTWLKRLLVHHQRGRVDRLCEHASTAGLDSLNLSG